MDVKNKKVVILGAARSGVSAALLLKNLGSDLFVSDIANKKQKQQEIKILEKLGIPFEFGQHSNKIYDADFVVLSPGISIAIPKIQSILKKGIPIYSEVEVASWFCKSPIIAITGSNGKTTTTTLLGKMLQSEMPEAIIAGNIGSPLSGQVLNSNKRFWASVEISSFQLETIDRFHPKVVVILNLAPNHLDWYSTFEDYVNAKLRIVKNLDPQDYLIYNNDDPLLVEKVKTQQAKKLCFSLKDHESDAYTKNEAIFLNNNKLIDISQVMLKGQHNQMNIMAAALAAKCANISEPSIIKILSSFTSVEHRLEHVQAINNISFINDSKATTLESLSVALQSFDTPIILIAGGKDKGSDYSRVNSLLKKKVRAVILIGSAQDKMASAWQDITDITRAISLEEAVHKAFSMAHRGDVVLLSPACSSFDMFQDFEDRGRKFKQIVNKIASEYEDNQAKK